MKSPILFIALAVFALSVHARLIQLQPMRCSEGEVYVKCGSSCREPTCRNRGKNVLCLDECHNGCFCDQSRNFVRDDNGRCIPESECPPSCSEGEVYKCGSPCGELWCSGRHEYLCSAWCYNGCFCDQSQSFMRDDNGRCIPESECPQAHECGEHEFFTMCKRVCSDRFCPGGALIDCAYRPCGPGCLCEAGYVRYNGRCIEESTCPPQCGEHEIFTACKGVCSDPLCPGFPLPRCAFRPCAPGCSCEAGYVRHNGKCIDESTCPPPLLGVPIN